MIRRFILFACIAVATFTGCKTVFEAVRGKSFLSVNSSSTELLKGVVPANQIDPNFIRMRITDVDLSRYPDSVALRVFVRDDRGNFVPRLAPPYEHLADWKGIWNEVLEKYDEEKVIKRPIPEYSVTEVDYRERPPLSVALVMDYSRDMKGKTVEMEYTAETILFLKRDTDQMTIIKYDDLPVVEIQPTTDKKAILDNFKRDGITRFGRNRGTCTALAEAIAKIGDYPGDRAIFLFSSGPDNASKLTPQAVTQSARDKGIRIFAVGTDRSQDSLFQAVAKYTGGRYMAADDIGSVEGLFEDMFRSLYSCYILRYKPPVYFGSHTVRIQALLPDASNEGSATAQYNTQEFDPYAPAGSARPLMIEYEFNRADIREESFPLLDGIARMLKDHPSLRIEVRSHIDQVGKEDYNQKLSEDRANAVRAYLAKAGIEPGRVTAAGAGSAQPLVRNDTESNRRINRRTEFIITSR